MAIFKNIFSACNMALKPSRVKTLPIYFQIEPTTLCNLNCKMCSRKKKIDTGIIPNLKNMALNEFENIIQTIQPSRIQISGQGEPFLNSEIISIIQSATQRKIKTTLLSNFTLPDKTQIMQLAKSGLDLFKISLDAATPQTYQKIRGVDKFNVIINNIKTLNSIKEDLGITTPKIRLQFCIQQDNYQEMLSLLKLAKDIRVDAIYFQSLELTDFEEHTEELIGQLTPSKLLAEINKTLEFSKQINIATNLADLKEDFNSYWSKYEWNKQKQPIANKKGICLFPWFSTYITVDGEVKPCCCFSREKISFGNLFTTPFPEIWNNQQYIQFRKNMKKEIFDYDICRNCVAKDFSNIIKMKNILPGMFK